MSQPRNHIGGTSVNVIKIGGKETTFSHSNSHLGSGLFTVEEAVLLDKKIDDGLARSGKVTGHNEFVNADSSTDEQCLVFSSGTTHNPALFAGGASYNMGSDFKCNVSFDTAF